MAITKILYIDGLDQGNPAKHLKQALNYIQNPDKTEERVLVGSINCLPETAFEQMMETKQIFGKTDKRQGYHIIISFPPGEATEEQAFEITRRFAEEFLGEQYEVVYSVHTDKEHKHGHIVWNSVDMQNGRKYEYKKGDWKYKIQPITNKLCKEFGLSIMPAEYSKEPKNLPRKEWEKEQSFKEYILRDAKFCAAVAGSVDHFEFLMKKLGYEFKPHEYMMVRVPGRKYYHKLERMDEMFLRGKLNHYLDMPWMAKPYYYAGNPMKHFRRNLSSFQKKYYSKMYRLRIIEQKRFYVGSARYAEDLKKFHLVQDEYLMIVQNDIKDFGDLIDYKIKQKTRHENIDSRQHEIYKENMIRKRAIKSTEDMQAYQKWYLEVQGELNQLKELKKEAKYQQKLVDIAIHENLATASFDVLETELIVDDNEVALPFYYDSDKNHLDYEEPARESVTTKPAITNENSVFDEEVVDVTIQKEVEEEPVFDFEEIAVTKEEKDIDIAEISENSFPSTKETYLLLSVSERILLQQISPGMDENEVFEIIRGNFKANDYRLNFSEMYDEALELCKAFRKRSIEVKAIEIAEQLRKYGDYQYLNSSTKARIFNFEIENSSNNLILYKTVMTELGMRQDLDEQFVDYQDIYDETVKQQDKERGNKKWGKDRSR